MTIKLNKALEAEVRAKIGLGWLLDYQYKGKVDTTVLLVVNPVALHAIYGDRGLRVFDTSGADDDGLWFMSRFDPNIRAVKPHKNATAYLFGLSDTVTFEGAQELAGKPLYDRGFEFFSEHSSAAPTHIRSPGGNCWRIEEVKG